MHRSPRGSPRLSGAGATIYLMSNTSAPDGSERPFPGYRVLPQPVHIGRRYANAPIVEATINLQVSVPENLPVSDLAVVIETPEYSAKHELYEESASEWNDADERTTSRTVTGYRAMSADSTHGVVLTRNQFSFSRLGKYDGWDSFEAATRKCWESYQKITHPQTVNAVAVRFLNIVEIPNGSFEIRDYIRSSFDVPSHLPQVVSSFYSRIEIPLVDFLGGFSPTCILAIGSSALESRAATRGLVVDITVVIESRLETNSPSFSDDLAALLGKLRIAKNYVFESYITDATRGLIS